MPAERRQRPRRILVTGGAGFIGSTLALECQRRWPFARIVVLDDFRSGDFRNLEGFRGDVVAASAAGIRDAGRFDLIFHLASITDTTVHDQLQMVRDNVEGFRDILALARESNARVVYASSAATYGQASARMDEETPARPANVYAFSKVVLDNLARHAAADGLRVTGVRYFNVYGPREQHKKAAASMIYQLYLQMKAGKRPRVFRPGDQKRDFVHVDDVVEGTLLAAAKGANTVYNLGSGKARSFNELIAILNKAMGTKLAPDYFSNPYGFYQEFTEADLTRSKRELGYVPAFPLEAGVPAYLKALKA